MKWFSFYIGLGLVAVILGSCNPCKRLALKCPTHDSTTVITKPVKDTIFIKIPGDSIFVPVAMDDLKDLGLIAEESGRANVRIRFIRDTLLVTAKCDDDSLLTVIDYLQTTIENTKDRIVEVEKPIIVYKARKIHKVALWILLALILITGVWGYFKIKTIGFKAAMKSLSKGVGLPSG